MDDIASCEMIRVAFDGASAGGRLKGSMGLVEFAGIVEWLPPSRRRSCGFASDIDEVTTAMFNSRS